MVENQAVQIGEEDVIYDMKAQDTDHDARGYTTQQQSHIDLHEPVDCTYGGRFGALDWSDWTGA